MTFRTILVGVDGFKPALATVDVAADLARQSDLGRVWQVTRVSQRQGGHR